MDSQKDGGVTGKGRRAYKRQCGLHRYGERSRSNHGTGLKKVVCKRQRVYHRAGE